MNKPNERGDTRKGNYDDVSATGIRGLDDILCGGLTPNRLYLIEGVPGSGKTTLAMQYLMEGARKGEPVLYVTLSETEEELRAMARSHDWDLDGITIRELVPPEESLQPAEQYTMFHPAEVELSETTRTILSDVERLKPTRLVFDSLSELRLLAGDPLRYRRQLLALKQFFRGRSCTVLLLDDLTSSGRDLQVQSIAHGVLVLEQLLPEYGADRRRLRVIKHRGRRFRGGYHDYLLTTGGINVFPRLVAAEHRADTGDEKLSSGIAPLDALLGGGLERGTSTLIVGAAGTGKSSLASQYVAAAAARGQRSLMCIFDESRNVLLSRMRGLGVPLDKYVDAGMVRIRQVDPAELTPGEFSHAIRRAVDEDGARIVVIDSLNGYLNAMPGERYLTIHLHELLMFLGERGVATILVGAHQGLIGTAMVTPIDASYLADAVILMRYYENKGEVRQAISVMKKRGGQHERSIREFSLERGGIQVGPPLRNFRGVLTGVPIERAADVAGND
ncbi:MAG TPA: ATPase domain-containing protein [Usitatibacter sp.]|nr:ATPase domain-containing protein [Usitatibacter sp.]